MKKEEMVNNAKNICPYERISFNLSLSFNSEILIQSKSILIFKNKNVT